MEGSLLHFSFFSNAFAAIEDYYANDYPERDPDADSSEGDGEDDGEPFDVDINGLLFAGPVKTAMHDEY